MRVIRIVFTKKGVWTPPGPAPAYTAEWMRVIRIVSALACIVGIAVVKLVLQVPLSSSRYNLL
jgi:hypothetical protein